MVPSTRIARRCANTPVQIFNVSYMVLCEGLRSVSAELSIRTARRCVKAHVQGCDLVLHFYSQKCVKIHVWLYDLRGSCAAEVWVQKMSVLRSFVTVCKGLHLVGTCMISE